MTIKVHPEHKIGCEAAALEKLRVPPAAVVSEDIRNLTADFVKHEGVLDDFQRSIFTLRVFAERVAGIAGRDQAFKHSMDALQAIYEAYPSVFNLSQEVRKDLVGFASGSSPVELGNRFEFPVKDGKLQFSRDRGFKPTAHSLIEKISGDLGEFQIATKQQVKNIAFKQPDQLTQDLDKALTSFIESTPKVLQTLEALSKAYKADKQSFMERKSYLDQASVKANILSNHLKDVINRDDERLKANSDLKSFIVEQLLPMARKLQSLL